MDIGSSSMSAQMTGTKPHPTGQAGYDARWQRFMDCVALKQPDRMPVVLYGTFWLAKYGGITCKQLMYDYEKTAEIAERAVLEFEPDAVSAMVMQNAIGPVLELADFKQLQWPGHGVGDNQPYQYLDREYMTADEFDDFLFDPTGFYLQKYLPRVGGAFNGIQDLPPIPGLHYIRLLYGMRGFAKPSVRKALANMIKVGEEVEVLAGHHGRWAAKMAAHGYPLTNGALGISPYDFIADYFRGATQMMKDLYRNKEKLMALLDKAAIFLSRMIIGMAKGTGNPIVMIPIHWAPDAFMSTKQFETFWWPSFRKVMINLIDAGLIPMPLWEADCTKRLEIIKDIPPGKCIYWFERTDMVKANEVLGDIVALRGNLSPSMLTTGTPDDVDAAVKHLVDNVWNKGGKLILDAAFGLPDETPVENVRAMFNAARKYAG
jgi:uroporphyrinogen-III decarboxylase